VICIIKLNSQSFSAHPPGLNWQKISLESGNIFFPKGIESKALKVADIIHHTYLTDTTLGYKRFKINIVLQNQTVHSNGYVGIGPFISEYYLTPPHDPYLLGPIDWTQGLAIHEYRHVLQAMNSRTGLNNFIYHLLGEEAWGLSYGYAVPDWFAEGDAVHAETIHTNAGRGRMPSFVSAFRALHHDHILWSYNKVRNGSYKDLVPNHYVFGYTMVKYVNDHFGTNQWNKIFNSAVRYDRLILPFNHALKKYTGISESTLYKTAIGDLTSDSTDSELNDEIILKNDQSQVIKNYISPNSLANGNIIYLESSGNQLPALYQLSPDKRKRLITTTGISTDDDFTFKEPIACWTEITTSPRWENKDYSDIYYYNLKTKTRVRVTHQQKYFRPSLSNNLAKIACSEYLPDGSSSLVILNTAGSLLQQFKLEHHLLATFPVFEPGDSTILTVLRGNGVSSLHRFHLNAGSHQPILSPIQGLISNLSLRGDTVYFSSDFTGRDNLFALDLSSNKLFQFSFNSIGIRQFHIRHGVLWYNYPTSKGIQIRKKNLSDGVFKEIEVPPATDELNESLEDRVSDSTTFRIRPAGPYNNPFRIYSWTVRPDEGGNVFRVLAKNILGTMSATSAYSYSLSEKSHTINNSISIGSMYPVFTATVGNTFGRNIPRLNSNQDSIRWNETGLRLGATVPLTFFVHHQIINIQPSLSFGQYIPHYKTGERKNYQSTRYIRSALTFSSQQRKALQHVSSRFAQSFTLQWNRSVNNKADALDLLTSLNLPGLGKNHVMEFNLILHRQLLSDPYRYPIPSRFISGYEAFSSDRFLWTRAAYHLPLVYPDLGIQGLFFLKRIRSRFFIEAMNNVVIRNPRNLEINYHSIGTELLFDGNLFNALPVSFGLRFSHLNDTDLLRRSKKQQIEFIIEQLF
jgi:hypothetical protein